MDAAGTFARIYADRGWYEGSGPGSAADATYPYRMFLADYMRIHQVGSVLDLGCGDWQATRLIDWTGISYHGIDVVPDVLAAVEAEHGRADITFECADILDCRWPDADLILCKDVLQHWPDAMITEFGRKLGGRRALVTNDLIPGMAHADCELGGYRPVDLAADPFNWPVREMIRFAAADSRGRIVWLKSVGELCGFSGTG